MQHFFSYVFSFFPVKGNIAVLQKLRWKNWILLRCWGITMREMLQKSVSSSCSSNVSGRLVAPAGFEPVLRRCFLPNSVIVKIWDFFFSFLPFFFPCVQKVWCLVAIVIRVREKQTFGPPRSFLGVTSWCSQGCCSDSRLTPESLWPWNKTCSVRAAPLRQCAFIQVRWKCVDGSYRSHPVNLFYSQQNKRPSPVLRFFSWVWTLILASLLFCCRANVPPSLKNTSAACPHEKSRTNQGFFSLTCVNPAEFVTSESVTAVHSGVF